MTSLQVDIIMFKTGSYQSCFPENEKIKVRERRNNKSPPLPKKEIRIGESLWVLFSVVAEVHLHIFSCNLVSSIIFGFHNKFFLCLTEFYFILVIWKQTNILSNAVNVTNFNGTKELD